MSPKSFTLALLTALSMATAGCGVVQQGRAPAALRIDELAAANGADTSATFGGYLHSDVITNVTRNNVTTATRFSDPGRITLSLVLRDPGVAGLTNAPTELNTIQITRYRVMYRRTDGRNTQGVDVPYAFDSGLTMAVPASGSVQQTFDLVRVSAKEQPPLLALAFNGQAIDLIADVTLYGKDMHNNDVSVTGSIGITFANYGDPTS